MQQLGYVVITDYIKANTGEDLSDALQELILQNPNRTIFFPDGEYVIAKPICTPANPVHAVTLLLSNFAVIKAAENWSSTEAMIRLGAAEPFNEIAVNGSNYGITGGIIDGSDVANGISVDSGRETRIEKVSIKHTHIGIHIKDGANNHSSDADILDVNIVGNQKVGSIGVLIEGCDNTLTNMRIASVQIGIKILRTSQLLKNIHPLFCFGGEMNAESYADSCGFYDDTPYQTWYQNCYSDQFATGFRMRGGARNVYSDCFCFWYTPHGGVQTGFAADGKFCSVIRSSNVNFHKASKNNAYLRVGEAGGNGVIETPIFDASRITDFSYCDYLRGEALSEI
ncbi:MAG: hypothetical protein IKL84_08755 [Clostridia bacterium]|nr:hypothetical protein [Clostridia bacterium]